MTSRPIGVILVALLMWASGLLDILGGVILLSQSADPEKISAFGSSGGLVTSAIVSIIFGTLVSIVAAALLRGNTAARTLVTVFQVLSISGSLYLALAVPGNSVVEWIGLSLALISLLLLWSRKANTYFRRSS